MSHIKYLMVVLLAGLFIQCKKHAEIPGDETPAIIRTIHISSAVQLQAALDNALPGDEIVMADGRYNGKFLIKPGKHGTKQNPVILKGSRDAILDAGSTATGYVLYLQANYWRLQGFSISNGLKGLMADSACHNVVDSVKFFHIGEEAIHLRKFSSHNVIKDCDISYTGLKTPDYGEGIYIGSAKNNWDKYSNGLPDRCDSNQILSNKIGPNISAECIDIKEGTTGGIISRNKFDATGITGANAADSWVDVKGNYYLIENNEGYNPAGSVLLDGYQVNCAVNGWGNYNEFKNNNCQVNAAGYGFNIRLTSSNGNAVGNKVYLSNKATGALKGLTNIPVSN